MSHCAAPLLSSFPRFSMKPITLLALTTPLLLAGCNAAMWGNLAVLGVTFGIFFGTIGLGRAADTIRTDATSSTAGHR